MGKDLTQKKPTSGNGTRLSARVTASGGRQGPDGRWCLDEVFMLWVQRFRIFLKLGVALRGMMPYNKFIGSDVFSRTSGRDCGIKTTIQRKQSMENHKTGTDGDALSVSLVFVLFLLFGSFVFPTDCLFWRVVFLCAESYGKGRSYGKDGADTDG